MFDKVVVIGVGLIGGSFALALKRAGVVREVVGMGRSAQALERALALGLVDSITTSAQQAMEGASLVLVAAPVAQTKAILAALLPHLQEGTVITDAGSTKGDVVAAARAALGDKICQFVPGHPIAGRESNGPDAAIGDLYVGKKTVLTPLAENRLGDIERVAAAWQACGALVERLTAQEHDQVFAAVSHLPHLLAFALVNDIAHKPHADVLFHYAASGFRDFTRIAGSSAEMWRDISLANRDCLLAELDAYLAQLTTLRGHLAGHDGAAIEAVYANAARARRAWSDAIEAGERAPLPSAA